MPHFRLRENGAVTTIVADVSPGPEWEDVTPADAPGINDTLPPDAVQVTPDPATPDPPQARTEATGGEPDEEQAP